MSIHIRTYPRAGLIGNPSDGFFGRTIAFTFDHFSADLVLKAAEGLTLYDTRGMPHRFPSIPAFCGQVTSHGHIQEIKLLSATVKRFYDHAARHHASRLDDIATSGLSIRCVSTIPYQLGFAGSSAIIIAAFRALCQYFGVDIAPHRLANLALETETEELGIAGGLQDRVAQVYDGLVYMDFDQELMESRGYGDYVPLNPEPLKDLYIAYRQAASESSGVFHNDPREQFANGRPEMLDAIECWKRLTASARRMIDAGEVEGLGKLLNENFDQRAGLYNLDPANSEMVYTARKLGASAKFTGSGGGIIGCYGQESVYQNLVDTFREMGVEVFKPNVVRPPEQGAYDHS